MYTNSNLSAAEVFRLTETLPREMIEALLEENARLRVQIKNCTCQYEDEEYN